MHFNSKLHFIKKKEGTKITNQEMKVVAHDVLVHFDAMMLPFLAAQATEYHAASPSVNLSTPQLPARLMLLLNNRNICKRFGPVMMFTFNSAPPKNYHFCVQAFTSHNHASFN